MKNISHFTQFITLKKLLILILIFSSTFIYAQNKKDLKNITTQGESYLGSGITYEEAKAIALTDAQSKAINQMGVFIESSAVVQNYRLSSEVIRSITGAIIQSTVIDEKKEVEGNSFKLTLTVISEVSTQSLQEALTTYQNRSQDRNLIIELMKTVRTLRAELQNKKLSSSEEIEAVDELQFTNKRLSEFLSTKMVIDQELEIQKLTNEKIRIYLAQTLIPQLRKSMSASQLFNTIPTISKKGELILVSKYENIQSLYTQLLFPFIENNLKKTILSYEKKNLRLKPLYLVQIAFNLNALIYINNKKYSYPIQFLIETSITKGKEHLWGNIKKTEENISNLYLIFDSAYKIESKINFQCMDKKSSGLRSYAYTYIFNESEIFLKKIGRIKGTIVNNYSYESRLNGDDSLKLACAKDPIIPAEYTLNSIQNISIRYKRPSKISITIDSNQ